MNREVAQLAEYNVASATERRQAGETLRDLFPNGDEMMLRLREAKRLPADFPFAGMVAARFEYDDATNVALARYRILHAWSAP